MTRDWKTGGSINNVHRQWKDLILGDQFGITREDWNTVIDQTAEHVRGWSDQDIAGRVSCMVNLLIPRLHTLWKGKGGKLPFRWLPCRSLLGATVADHALTASAIAYCLGYDNGFRSDLETLNQLRLSALTVTWKDDGLGKIYDAVWSGLSPIEPKSDGDARECIVHAAKTVASKRLSVDAPKSFTAHPLKQYFNLKVRQVGLVSGGATKIKSYVFESARLPEIRGASGLLNRINIEDIPALFGRQIESDEKRYIEIRKKFRCHIKHDLNAPECVIYAAGGDCLAFTPASVVHVVADEIERIYSRETLVANSVAVGDMFDLLELQYGLKPDRFWIKEFQEAVGNEDSGICQIMESYFNGKEDKNFRTKKSFGELATKLAMTKFKRREGNSTPTNQSIRRDLPTHVEIGPYQKRCESCERRPAVINMPRALCEACTRKYVTGRVSKKNLDSHDLDRYLNVLQRWRPSSWDAQEGWSLTDWCSLFKNYLEETGKVECYFDSVECLKKVDGPQDLEDIAKASNPSGFVAFIYADGNNMGGYLENIRTPAQYRQFSERVFLAMQEAAFKALAKLKPIWIEDDGKRYIFPFEIISIGGDDLMLIVPGHSAFEIVHQIGVNFDSAFMSRAVYEKAECPEKSQRYQSQQWTNTANNKLPKFSMSLGFVLANEHTPIAFMEDLAAKLLKSAKSRAKTLKTNVGYSGGTVDFISLKSLSMITSELGDFRTQLYKTDQENVLTMRPFTLHELCGFIQTIRTLKESNFPRSQFYQLRQSLSLGRQTSTLEYLYFLSRLDKGKILQRELEVRWQNGLGPWYPMLTNKKCYETLLLDLIEAYEFIDWQRGDDGESNG